MSYNWNNPNEFSFNCILLMDRYMIHLICTQSFGDEEKYFQNFGVALAYNPAVAWYCKGKASEIAEHVDKLIATAPSG